ncbi:hypothetical protein [Paenibacillus antarcticus]|uniref:Uncharacterized protein n=1 Tax=Paenibacillus antarcticus TaxID=253703 RepID=A0A168PAE1_9BACL|nr:hypothetical protein [Paenibacillus antarcticus]OAB46563.1 hypothetical protein PBAT_11140 [Paenibacillus antarcticus]
MTKITHSLTAEDNTRIMIRYEEVFIRQIELAYESKKMDELTYRKFRSERCNAETSDEIYDYYQQLFIRLANYHQEQLQARIIKGAEYIDLIGPTHPHYSAALRKYETLCQRLKESKRGW